jgi:type I site-specific restriction endonuclease
MPALSFNEADTRAKLIDPALHRARWVEQVVDAERATHGEIRREQGAVRVEIIDGKPFKRGRGRVDYLLHAYVGTPRELTLAKGDEQITADKLKHFGEPVYECSLAQGIEDAQPTTSTDASSFGGRTA